MSRRAPAPAAPAAPAAHEHVQEILDHAATAIFVKDLDGRYLFVNREFERLRGRPGHEIVGKRDTDLYPEGVAKWRAQDRQVIEARRAMDFEDTVETELGPRTFISHRFPLFDSAGAPYAVGVIATDITDRRRSEEALRAAALAVSGAEGADVFGELCRYLAEILGADVAMIAVHVAGDPGRMRTLAVRFDGEPLDNFEYELEGSPCRLVVGREFRFVGTGVNREFPPGSLFAAAGLDSYAALPLNDSAGRPLGLMAVMGRAPMRDAALAEAMLKIFAVRAVAEIERAGAEEALRLREAQYKSIFDASADALALWNSRFERVDVNPAYERMYGYRREEVLAGSRRHDVPAETRRRQEEVVARTLAGEHCHLEHEDVRRTGERFPVEVRTIPIRHRGEPHVLAMIRDVTERRRADEALRDSEAQYRAIFAASTDALILWDSQFRRVDVNPAYERMFGRTRDEVIGRAYDPPEYPPEYARPRQELVRRALAGEPARAELESVRKNGERILTEVVTIPFRHRGEPHVLAIARDITERKRADEALRASEEQYRAIFNASADALVLWDSQFRRVDVNPAYERLYGWSRDEVIGRAYEHPAFSPEYARARLELVRRALAGEACHAELEAIRKNGERVPTEVRAIPFQHRGQPHVLTIARDITERKRAESERQRLEAQLRQAQKMEAIGHLTGGIAHDFNNLLTSIMGYVTLAAERPAAGDDAKLADYLDQASRSCLRARDLIQQMLTFSRGRRGEPRRLALAPVVREAARLLRASFPATVALDAALDAAAPEVLIDPVQLEQVLMNLAINARDAMHANGTVRIDVGRARLAEAICASCRKRVDGDWVELGVADSGQGIAPEVQERMFEPFYTTKEVGQGSGMGLATVHGIVHDHGGHLLVETAPGRGAHFRVLLPAVAEKAGAPPSDPARSRPAAVPRTRLGGRIAVVDDETAVGGFMRDLLTGWGLEVTLFSDARSALAALADGAPFDLVVTDQTMPGQTGVEFARAARRLRPALPVVLYTGYRAAVPPEEIAQAGIVAVVEKPIDPAALLAVIRTSLPSGAA